jgi:hypothetical protein
MLTCNSQRFNDEVKFEFTAKTAWGIATTGVQDSKESENWAS